jgi:multiple sugar transport system permease protein
MISYSLIKNPSSSISFSDMSNLTLSNYKDVLASDSFDVFFLNSLIVSGLITFSNIIFCLFVGYSIARWKSLTSKMTLLTIMSVLMIPPHVIMIPLYRLIVSFGWINTYASMIFPWLVTPFGVFLVKQYVENIPEAIENAARIDGASNFQVLTRIVAPITNPVLVVLAIYTFLSTWNSFLFPFLFTNTEDMRTLPVGLTFYLGKQSIDWGHLMAGASISAIPIIILYILFRRQIIQGLIAGSLKE